ncbi:hypothetical protein AB0C07_38975 [Actinoplanes missouriensis]|uniref:hypothetical protein n=1 Tax=Actinoplanes missouriensis TaxID=1866 RepID=UPI0033FE5486
MIAEASSGEKRWLLWAIAVIGLITLVIAGWKIYFAADPGAALIALVIIGAVLLISPFVLPYLQAVAVNADGFELRLVREIAAQGAPETARLLNHTELAEIAEAYGVVHTQLAGDAFLQARTQVQDQLVARASAFARRRLFDPAEIKELFPKATAPVRVLLLGLMKGDPRLVDAPTLISALTMPVTANEQYHALELAEKNLRHFTEADRTALFAALGDADFGRATSKRYEIAERLKDLAMRAQAAGSSTPPAA